MGIIAYLSLSFHTSGKLFEIICKFLLQTNRLLSSQFNQNSV
ncbi:hypothetical protein HPS12939_0698 [Glaesserella parasuis 12939]|nr:hypothetical protein HPS12939_0698 [Glaesserella parasuis 12939]